MFGLGGGILVVPTLYLCLSYYQGIPANLVMHMAVATSLALMILNTCNVTYKRYKSGEMLMSMVKLLASPIMLGALLGAALSDYLHSNILRYFFITFMVYTIVSALVRKGFTKNRTIDDFKIPNKPVAVLVGFATGLVSVLLGIGGSVITLPYLRRAKMPMKNATAVANALTLAVAVVGVVTYVFTGWDYGHLPKYSLGFVYLPAFVGMAIGTFIGVPLGIHWSRLLADKLTAKLYIVVLVIVLIMMVV